MLLNKIVITDGWVAKALGLAGLRHSSTGLIAWIFTQRITSFKRATTSPTGLCHWTIEASEGHENSNLATVPRAKQIDQNSTRWKMKLKTHIIHIQESMVVSGSHICHLPPFTGTKNNHWKNVFCFRTVLESVHCLNPEVQVETDQKMQLAKSSGQLIMAMWSDFGICTPTKKNSEIDSNSGHHSSDRGKKNNAPWTFPYQVVNPWGTRDDMNKNQEPNMNEILWYSGSAKNDLQTSTPDKKKHLSTNHMALCFGHFPTSFPIQAAMLLTTMLETWNPCCPVVVLLFPPSVRISSSAKTNIFFQPTFYTNPSSCFSWSHSAKKCRKWTEIFWSTCEWMVQCELPKELDACWRRSRAKSTIGLQAMVMLTFDFKRPKFWMQTDINR